MTQRAFRSERAILQGMTAYESPWHMAHFSTPLNSIFKVKPPKEKPTYPSSLSSVFLSSLIQPTCAHNSRSSPTRILWLCCLSCPIDADEASPVSLILSASASFRLPRTPSSLHPRLRRFLLLGGILMPRPLHIRMAVSELWPPT